MNEVGIAWSHGRAAFVPTAGMLTRCTFLLPGGDFAPFARAPWLDSALDHAGGGPSVSGHVGVLGGEFVGVPFGSSGVPGDAIGWHGAGQTAPEPAHGPGAEEDWTLVRTDPHSVSMRLDYPESSPVASLERTVSGVPGEPALAFRLTIHARRPARVPVGLHPILRLPDRAGALTLDVAFDRGRTYPGTVPGGLGIGAPGHAFESLTRVPTATEVIDFTRLPFDVPVEDVLQLCRVRGPLTAAFTDDAAGVRLDWDLDVLPSLLLWVSDRGIPGPPWNGIYRGLGVEPIASAFDLPGEVSVGDNPIAADAPTSVAISPDRPTVIDYSVSAFPLPPRSEE